MGAVIRFATVVACIAVPAVSLGGGTLSLAEIDPLLRQKPQIRSFLMSSLDMDATVMAAVRFGPHVKGLGGARMGPYIVQARPKRPPDASPLEIVVCTEAQFFDTAGKATPDEVSAVRMEEKLTLVMLREVNSAPATPNCP